MSGWKDRIRRIAAGHRLDPRDEGRARSDLAKFDRDVLGPTFRDLIAEFNQNGFRATDDRGEADGGGDDRASSPAPRPGRVPPVRLRDLGPGPRR